MIDFREAQKIAKNEMPGLDIIQCIDIGTRFAFLFGVKSTDVVPPGTPIICINKSDGKISYLTIPPLENSDLLEKGQIISLE